MDVDVYVTTSVREFSDIQEEEKKVGPAYWSTISNDFKDATNIEYGFVSTYYFTYF